MQTMRTLFSQRSLGIYLGIACVAMVSAGIPIYPAPAAQAATVQELEQQRQAAAAAKAKAEQQAAAQRTTAQKAALELSKVSGQIQEVQSSITETSGTITATSQKIDEESQMIAELESKLRGIQDQQDSLLRQLYMLRVSMNDTLGLLGDSTLSKQSQDRVQFLALKQTVTTLYAQTSDQKLAIQKEKDELEKKNSQLIALKDQQEEQRRGLAQYRANQAELKTDAESAVKRLESDAQKAAQRVVNLEGQIRTALAAQTANNGVYGSGPGVGTRVQKGDFVGVQGSTGFSTGDHVHFETTTNGPARGDVSPWPYLNSGELSWPLRNFVITQEYGNRSGWYASGYHSGIDIAGPIGSAVYSPCDCTVVLNQDFGGYGRAWVGRTDSGLFVLLGHMRR
jgi:septal ring factor EnvC (AmiA/AmiB activator)